MKECKECYSKFSRITPLLKPRECLENHTQYICGTCGRCICIEIDKKRNVQRWNFPFKTLKIAELYLRTADFTTKKNCGIYELINENGRKSYKIFDSQASLNIYVKKNRNKRCIDISPIYQKEKFVQYPNTQIRKLTKAEVDEYLEAQQK